MEAPRPYYVAWLDINTHAGPWVELPDDTPPSACYSIGWLLQQDDDSVTISATYSDEGDRRSALITTVIPRGCITKLQELSFPILETPAEA